ncbi:hypothetical protein KCU88_g350, partial [Aureobasidium melanogenum]
LGDPEIGRCGCRDGRPKADGLVLSATEDIVERLEGREKERCRGWEYQLGGYIVQGDPPTMFLSLSNKSCAREQTKQKRTLIREHSRNLDQIRRTVVQVKQPADLLKVNKAEQLRLLAEGRKNTTGRTRRKGAQWWGTEPRKGRLRILPPASLH